MSSTLTSPTGNVLQQQATKNTTAHESSEAKTVRINMRRARYLAETREYLENTNVRAFLKAVSAAEGGGYDFKFGAQKGLKQDP